MVDKERTGTNTNSNGPYAELKPGTPMEGVRLGGRGKDLRVGQKLRAVMTYRGRSDEFKVHIKGRIYEHGDEPEIMLLDLRERPFIVPQSALEQRTHGVFQFRRAKPNAKEVRKSEAIRQRQEIIMEVNTSSGKLEIEQIQVGQYVEGERKDGTRATFFVSAINQESGRPLLETVTERQKPKRYEMATGRDGMLRAGRYRLVELSHIRNAINKISRDLSPTNELRIQWRPEPI